jgi:hypothetical protein
MRTQGNRIALVSVDPVDPVKGSGLLYVICVKQIGLLYVIQSKGIRFTLGKPKETGSLSAIPAIPGIPGIHFT